MKVDITEVSTKTALVRSRIPGVEDVINPYIGCGHGCAYCNAVFMRKYSKQHQHAKWGSFVEAKTNIVDVLRAELARKRKTGTAMMSSVCDPYQPAESRYRLTQGCLLALRENGWLEHPPRYRINQLAVRSALFEDDPVESPGGAGICVGLIG